ncbi:MAG: dockerin type I repeat-containing protein, partial [Ruminococcus sp.]
GNQNFREMSFTIKDPSQEQKPVFLSSNPLTGNQIKTGTATNLSVNAAGGNTGTKLLFYKYVVKDPAGEQVNTAYYTLNKNYSFTATKTGTYTVDVSVQGSDNQTITQQLKFESTQNPTDPTEDTQPTSPTVTTPSKTDPTVTTPTTATEPSTPDPSKILGDVNGDGVLDIRDSALIQKRHTGFIIDSYDETVSDFNKDGEMNVKDAVAIQKFLAKAN